MRGTLLVQPRKSCFREWWVSVCAFTFALLFSACGAAQESEAKSAPTSGGQPGMAMDMSAQSPAAPPPAAAPEPMTEGESSGNALGAPAPPPPPSDPAVAEEKAEPSAGEPVLAKGEKAAPLLIYRAFLTMAVFETKKVINAIEALAKSRGGYLVARDDVAITVRVPVSTFDAALTDIAKQGDELRRQVQVEDVTAEYNDLSIELKNAQDVRERLVVLLDKAQKVEEALAVEAELARLTDKIERIKGRLKLLNELVAFSTITVRFEARAVEQVNSNVQLPFPWLKQLGLGELLSL